jgi:large subunit ribosomal protein L30e
MIRFRDLFFWAVRGFFGVCSRCCSNWNNRSFCVFGMDVAKAVRMVVDSGKVVIGSERSKKAVLRGEGKLLLLASNCPREVREDLERYAKLSSIPSFEYAGGAMELGTVCGKPFPIAALTVMEEGNSNILDVLRAPAQETAAAKAEEAEAGRRRVRERKVKAKKPRIDLEMGEAGGAGEAIEAARQEEGEERAG